MALTNEDLIALARPFRMADHEFKEKYVYIAEEAVTGRLDEVDPSWQFEILEVGSNRDKQVFVTARLTVKDVSRCNTGMQDVNNGPGEPEKGATTDALKRCARLFGIGRYLLGAPGKGPDFDKFLATVQREAGIMPPNPAPANDKPPIDLGKAREELSNGGDRRATRDMDAIYTATKLHWKDRKHFDNAVKKLVADGVLNSGMTDAQAIAAINANRASEDKANAGWWTDKTVAGTLGADVWKEFGITLPDALAKLNQTLPDFSGPNAVKDAIRNQLQFEAIR
jgi:hypothetical protein